MEVEFNKKFKKTNTTFNLKGGGVAMVTPPLDEDYWIFRVKLFKDQAIVAFPKFMTFGVGFAIEDDDWNTNFPYTCTPTEICNHIWKNKKYEEITRQQVIEAIVAIQECIYSIKREETNETINKRSVGRF